MKVGDLVDFEFEDTYTGLIILIDIEFVKVLFQDEFGVVTYTHQELEDIGWELISESR